MLAIVGGLAAVIAVVTALLLLERMPFAALWTLPFLAATAAGLWAVRVEPDNPAARRLLQFGVLALVWVGGSMAFTLVVYDAGLTGALVPVNTVLQVLGLLMTTSLCAALVSYPDGVARLRAEKVLIRTMVVLSVAVPLVLLVASPRIVPAWILEWANESGDMASVDLASPVHVEGLGAVGDVAGLVLESALGILPAIAVVVAVLRYRLLDRTQRARMAWPLQAGLVLILVAVADYLVLSGVLPPVLVNVVDALCMILLPISLGIGIARPRLFDVLGTVRRTLGFATLSLVIVLAYVATAGVMGAAVGRDNLQVAVVVAVIAALALDPVRRRLLRGAGRLVFGEQVSRDELLVRLGATLEHTLDRDELTVAIAETAREGLGAEWMTVSLTGEQPVHVGRAVAADEVAVCEARVAHGRDDLGSIASGLLARGRFDATARSLLETLASQAAMALTNARLAERLVTAEETARRRLERDLHDGAQQDLAALLTRIGLARNQLTRGDPELVAGTLDTLHGDAQLALENLRELASGIHPTVLADRGLVEAIENRAGRLPLRVDVHAGPGVREGRLSQSAEGAAYFTVCEALANTLKHGAAVRAVVSLRLDGGQLRIEVSDDGCGFDAAGRNGSGGLAGLEDRLAALGGDLEVRSRAGEGTTLLAVVPTGS